MVSDILQLEPDWKDISIGTRVNFLAETVVWDPNHSKTLVRTAIHRRFLVIEGPLQQVPAISVLNGRLVSTTKGIRITTDATSYILHHSGCTFPDLWNVSEICSGIGAMSDGISSAGGFIKNKNELRPPLVAFQRQQGFSQMVEGNIGDTTVLAEFLGAHPHSTMLVAGFNCQPWSKLGDQRQLDDPRSMSLIFALRTAFYCRSHAVMLECVSEVGTDAQVMQIIEQWCRITGFQMSTTQLKLEDFWPSRRSRWWCLLTNPSTPPIHLLPLPKQINQPTVSDLFPSMPFWPAEEEQQLSLDLYETNKFLEFDSFDSAIVKSNQPLPTALHGWGNQLQGCPCGCRKGSMDHFRLKRKGLFGALIIMEGHLACVDGDRLRSRHIHPWELSVLTGCPPNKRWMPNLRLALCGLGQMASPIQSCWIYSQYKYALGKHLDLSNIATPEEALWAHVKIVFQSYQEVFPQIYQDPKVSNFVAKTHELLFESHMNRVVPSPIPPQEHATGITAHQAVSSQPDAFVDPHTADEPSKSFVRPGHQDILATESSAADPPQSQTFDTHDWDFVFEDSYGGKLEFPPTINLDSPEIVETSPVQPVDQPRADVLDKQDSPILKPFDSAGGIVAFSRNPRPSDPPPSFAHNHCLGIHVAPPKDSRQSPLGDASVVGDVPVKSVPSLPVETTTEATFASPSHGEHSKIVQIFIDDSSQPTFIRVPSSTTISELVAAEVNLGTITTPIYIKDAVGGPLPIQKVVDSFEQIHIHQADTYRPATVEKLTMDSRDALNRISLLHQQEGWVAQDEMDFYLGFLQQLDGVGFLPSLAVPAFDSKVKTWVSSLISLFPAHRCAASALLQDNHWHPIVLWTHDDGLRISTTTNCRAILEPFFGQCSQSSHFVLLDLPCIFHADCGFQTIGAVLQEVLDHTPADDINKPLKSFPVDTHTAVVWRTLFETHLHSSGLARQQLASKHIRFGGGLMGTPEDTIAALLQDHGVPSSEISQRTRVVFEKLSRHQILQAIRSHRPWAELKTLCNNQTPKVQLVLPSELAQSIKNRIARPEPFGDKSKKKQKGGDHFVPIVLSPHEVSIPDGIFKQGTDKLLKQIPVQAIGPETSGIVVVTPQDAEPYLRLSKPISTQGLGLLLLDHSHPSCAGSGSLIRFPCKCELTNEPILVSARLIQIGSIEVTKYVPSTAGTVDEVSTNVFRVALYKDEIGEEWDHIIQHPIKHILTVLGIDNKGTNPSVVDVWDRQFLTINMTRTKAAHCEIFFASIRLVGANCQELQARSGFSGLYVEPRSIDGRNPSEHYRVIWLKLDKASTTAAMQSSNLPVHLARHGVRYGLRASSDIAEEVHRFHKATVPYLDTVNVLKFLVGPFPFGATRDGITKVFEQWGWCARPTQPKGRAPDGIGIQWEVHASNQPPCDVYSMTHGDVIIAALPVKKPSSKVGSDLLASAKTIAYLRHPKPSNAIPAEERDPIQVNDPWASYVPSKAARTPSAPSVDPTLVRVGQIESLAASVDRKLADHMAQVDHKLSNADVPMGPPPGMDQQVTNEGFEHRLQALEKSMHQQQAQQAQHQSQVAHQFQQMQVKIDTQTQSFHSHLDQRMTEQLSQIEALLSKKARTE